MVATGKLPLVVSNAMDVRGVAQNDELSRVAAVDVVRGILVLLAFGVLLGLPALREWPATTMGDRVLRWLAPSPWNGVTLADLVMPGFLFITGLSAGLSVERRLRIGASTAAVLRHLLLRSAGVFAIGLVLDGGLPAPFAETRWLGPFQRIAICHLVSGAMCLFANGWGRLLVAALLLVNYGFAFESFPAAPPMVAGRPAGGGRAEVSPYSERHNIAADVDRRWLPGRKYFGDWDSCGLLTTLPAVGLSLLGAAACIAFRRTTTDAGWLIGWGGLALGVVVSVAGWTLDGWQPLNAALLTPPFVLFAAGIWWTILCLAHPVGRFPSTKAATEGVCRLGRTALVLMLALHLLQRLAPPPLAQLAETLGFRTGYLQTLLAVLALTALVSIAGLRTTTSSLLPSRDPGTATRSAP